MGVDEQASSGRGERDYTPASTYIDGNRINQFRLRAKYILLTYSQAGEEFDWMKVVEKIHDMNGKIRIAREKHKDGGVHYHAFCVCERRFITRDSNRFNVDYVHPNIQPIMKTPHHAWRYVAKDGDVLLDEIPVPPAGRAKTGATASNEVWTEILSSTSRAEMLKRVEELQPRAFCTSFNNIFRAAEYRYPSKCAATPYTSPPNLVVELDAYPEIRQWRDEELFNNAPDILDIPDLSDGTGSLDGASSWPESTGVAVEDQFSDVTGLYEIETDDAFANAILTDCPQLSRYPSPPFSNVSLKPTNTPQRRRKSLILWGQSQIGKTLVARSFGRHCYFNDMFNLDEFDDDAEYAVFDDIPGGFKAFNYKGWLGAQHQFNATDKYKRKQTIIWNRPCVFLCNDDPMEKWAGGDTAWLRKNAIVVEVTSPLCNLAR
nr:MAG TPA: Geminivirus Rep catalytic domain [Genomoviridae sp.]